MGCSDVSEFEHIYGQICTTPSCVYDRLFTWTRMVDIIALIVWNTLTYICFSIKSSLWAFTAAYTKFRRMIWSMIWSCGHRSRSPMCIVTSSKRRETSLGKSWKHVTWWFPDGSSHYRSWSAYLDSNFDVIDAVLMRKSWHYFVTITWLESHSQEPSGDGNLDELHHRRTQDFTMEEVHVVGAWQRVWPGQVPQWGSGAKPR